LGGAWAPARAPRPARRALSAAPRAQAAQQAQAEQMQGYMDTYRDAFLFVDTAAPGWRVLHLNQAAVDKLGARPRAPGCREPGAERPALGRDWELDRWLGARAGMDMEAVRGHAFWDLFCAYEDTTRSRVRPRPPRRRAGRPRTAPALRLRVRAGGAQVSSAMLFDMVAAGKEFTINNAQWRHSTDSAQHRLFTMVFRWRLARSAPAACLGH